MDQPSIEGVYTGGSSLEGIYAHSAAVGFGFGRGRCRYSARAGERGVCLLVSTGMAVLRSGRCGCHCGGDRDCAVPALLLLSLLLWPALLPGLLLLPAPAPLLPAPLLQILDAGRAN